MTLLNRAGAAERLAARELGTAGNHLCREPWESYYILRRGILPCCHGSKAIAPMDEWETAWNSPALQDIRRHLARGRLSPYCLDSTGCPIVQRYLEAARRREQWLPSRLPFLSTINRLLRGAPAAAHSRLLRWLWPPES
jgi:hypothetical protein